MTDDNARLRQRCARQRRELRRLNAKLASQVATLRDRYAGKFTLTTEYVAMLQHERLKYLERAQKAEGRVAELEQLTEQQAACAAGPWQSAETSPAKETRVILETLDGAFYIAMHFGYWPVANVKRWAEIRKGSE